MLKAFKVSSVIIVALLLLMISVSCGSTGPAPSGALPVLHTGDTWTQQMSVNDNGFTEATLVSGQQVYNGIDCYTLFETFTPAWIGISTMTTQIDKTTLNPVGVEAYGSVNGIAFTITTNISDDYSVKPYPLSVDKTWTDTESATTTTLASGQSNTSTEIYNYTVKVESMESVKVPAGTFKCFKMVRYIGSTNAVDATLWVTTDIGVLGGVKEIDSHDGLMWELMSYSLSK